VIYAPPEENTLGVVIGGKSRQSRSAALGRLAGTETPKLTSLGTTFVGIGAAVLLSVHILFEVGWLAFQWEKYPDPISATAAWILLIIVIAGTITSVQLMNGQFPRWLFALFLIGLASVVALDLYAIWPLHDIGSFVTAAAAAGTTLLLVLAVRPSSDIAISVSTLGVALVVAVLVNVPLTADNLAPQITTVASAVIPTFVALSLFRNVRRLVEVELGRVLVESTLTSPRLAVGMLASEELARLDFAAEKFLDSVENGSNSLPLSPKLASTAASLATELRLHLIEGRRETWLRHAIAESDLLGKSVTLTDRGSLAGLLNPVQREGLFSTAWLFVTDTTKFGAKNSVHITFSRSPTVSARRSDEKVAITITITTLGVARSRLDGSTREAIAKIGSYTESAEDSSVRLDIECLVNSPAAP
jgi:hypothetical protein